ncbi:MAG: TonB-dependent receptor plug domain-containing protein [Pseudomonadales bacterium]|nr:TonB-dependent receptor plug domain-containing protein [Pseudomonadales bacterium]
MNTLYPTGLFTLLISFSPLSLAVQQASYSETAIFDLNLDTLSEIKVQGIGSLTKTERAKLPVAVTELDEKMIRNSGARDLEELFDIFIPNVQIIRHDWQVSHTGTRGTISDRDNKYLLLINGRVMNNHTQLGVFSEKDLPQLADIQKIDFIRGPGSVIYGPGAISNVVNIITHNGESFSGMDVQYRQGLEEKYAMLETRFAHKFSNNSHLFVYYGVSDYAGADDADSPLYYSKGFQPSGGGAAAIANEPVPWAVVNDHQGFRDKLKNKFHIEYTLNNYRTWLRYTNGGEDIPPTRAAIAEWPLGFADAATDVEQVPGNDHGYKQFTWQHDYVLALSEVLSMDFSLSYDSMEVARLPSFGIREELTSTNTRSYREDEFNLRLLVNWDYSEKNIFGAGFEYAYEKFGLDNHGFPDLNASTQNTNDVDAWSTTAPSVFVEHQGLWSHQWTTFLGLRLDDHDYTDLLTSGRAALIYTPTPKDSIKGLLNRAVRRSVDDSLRVQWLNDQSKGDTEKTHTFELRYERQQSSHLFFATSYFYQDRDVVGFNFSSSKNSALGNLRTHGLEWEINYLSESWQLTASHGFTKLLTFDLLDPTTNSDVSANAYGYGDDLGNWSNHISKVYFHYPINKAFSFDSSLRIYWGFPGAEDLSNYNNDLYNEDPDGINKFVSLSDPGEDDAFKENIYLNMGAEFRLGQGFKTRLDLHNMLGWADDKYNKRNFLTNNADYRSEAPAISVSFYYQIFP